MKIIKSEIAISNDKGILKEIVKGYIWKQLNHIITKQSSIRGKHYHKNTLECFYILNGKLELHIRNIKTEKESTYQFEDGSCFIIEPYEFHTLRYLTDVELIVLLSQTFNSKNPDVYKDGT